MGGPNGLSESIKCGFLFTYSCAQHRDNLNPKWVKKIQIVYKFEEVQSLKFVCYDIDDPKAGLAQQDLIGETVRK